MVIEAGKKGKSVTGMAVAIGVAKPTLYEWVKTYPDFSNAVTIAKALSQEHWEQIGYDALHANTFQATVYNRQMRNRFREDHGDVKEVVQRQSGVISSEPLTAEEWEEVYKNDE